MTNRSQMSIRPNATQQPMQSCLFTRGNLTVNAQVAFSLGPCYVRLTMATADLLPKRNLEQQLRVWRR